MWRRHSIGGWFVKAELHMLHGSREGGEVLVMMSVRICFLRLFRMPAGMCVEMLASGTGAVHLACRLARRRRPYDAGDVVGKVKVNLPGYCVVTVGRMWIELCIGSSSSSGVGGVFVSVVMLIDSRPVGEVGYPTVSIIFSWSRMRE